MNIDWGMWASIAVIIYTIVFIISLVLVYLQLKSANKTRSLQTILAVFEQLQTQEARRARRYIYIRLPQEIEGIPEDELTEHLMNVEEAFVAFDRVGYLVIKGYLKPSNVIEFLWIPIWKCWKKSEKLILQTRQRRNEPTYLDAFRRLYRLSELHRVSNSYKEPTI